MVLMSRKAVTKSSQH